MSSLVEIPADTSILDLAVSWLDGYEVMVLNGGDSLEKTDIEQKVANVGGKIVQSPPVNQSNFLAIAGKDCGIRVKNFKALKSFDLIDVDWFLECEKKSKFLAFKARNFFFLTEETKEALKNQNQVFSFETNEELKQVLAEIVDYDRDTEAISVICKEFLKHEIELPKYQKRFNQVIPLNKKSCDSDLAMMKEKFEMLKIQMVGAKFC